MSSTKTAGYVPANAGFMDRERIVAKPGFNRWLVPPAALAIHLCIGMAYGFSVFWLPLTKAIGITETKACPDMTLMTALFTTTCDWRVSDLTIMYTLFFIFLGGAAALFGGWLERAGPRKAGAVAALFWGGGMIISAFGIYSHQLWIMWLGSGVIGGVGLGLGYISPVSTLIKWFPDRRGMATGMAIMGFGGGAMIGSPLANNLMNYFKTDISVGVWETFAVMGIGYFIFMMAGAFGYRIPPAGWRPDGWTAPAAKSAAMTTRHVHLRDAHKTTSFWMIWFVLMLNVAAGIGVLGIASPMLQEIFGGTLIGQPDLAFSALDATQKTQIAGIAAGFVGMLSLFNILGRFFWASLSDKIGRRNTYFTFLILGILLYCAVPWAAGIQSKIMFVGIFCIILSMYGGGFATVPAYLADIFGTQFVGAIHGRLLTAWSTAALLGPFVITYIRETQKAAGLEGIALYSSTMYILASFLAVGVVCNFFVRPLADKWFMSDEEVAALQAKVVAADGSTAVGSHGIGRGGVDGKALAAWAVVGIPILWGISITIQKSAALF